MNTPDFSNMMAGIFKKHSVPKKKNVVCKEIAEVIQNNLLKSHKWFNIHRVTTNGRVNQPVIWRVNEKDANLLINKFLKASETVHKPTDKTECTYYEKFVQGSSADVYANQGNVVKEDSDVQ